MKVNASFWFHQFCKYTELPGLYLEGHLIITCSCRFNRGQIEQDFLLLPFCEDNLQKNMPSLCNYLDCQRPENQIAAFNFITSLSQRKNPQPCVCHFDSNMIITVQHFVKFSEQLYCIIMQIFHCVLLIASNQEIAFNSV